MTWWAIGISAASAVVGIAGQQQAKKAAQQDAAFQAEQQLAAAQRSRAIGQRQSAEERRNARLVSSALQARAMGGGTDPGVVQIEQDIAAEGEYRALAALYEGDMGALGLERQAGATLRSGKARADAYQWQTYGTILNTAGSIYGSYTKGTTPGGSYWGVGSDGSKTYVTDSVGP